MKNKKKLIIIIVVTIIIIAIGVAIYYMTNPKDKDKNYDENLGDGDSSTPDVPKQDKSILTNNQPLPNTPFKNSEEGNAFRAWVNDNYSNWAKENQLDRTGAFNNTYIKKAWAKFGNEYLKITNNTPKVDSKYGFKKGNPVYIKGDAAGIYNYPDPQAKYRIKTLYKTQYLDKPIGIFIQDAVKGFIQIEDIYAPNKGKKYYVSIATVTDKKY